MKTVSVSEMQELDRKTIEDIGIPSIVLMDNAGRYVSEVVAKVLEEPAKKKIAVFCGAGNNGGDGFVAAIYLSRLKAELKVYLLGKKEHVKKDPAVNLNILKNIGISVEEIDSLSDFEADLIIDAIFGIGLKGDLREPARSIIHGLNDRNIPIVSIDVPSGLNADTGEVLGIALKASKTVTMQFPKKGFYINKGPEYIGEVIVADIGIIG